MQVPPPRNQNPHTIEYIEYCVEVVQSGDAVPVLREVCGTIRPVMVTPLVAVDRYDGQQMSAEQLHAAMERDNEKRSGRWN